MAKLLIPAIAGGAALSLVATAALATALRTNDVELTVDGASEALQVRARTVGELLDSEGITLGDHDVVLPSVDSEVTDGLEVSVAYGRPLELTVDGEKRTVWTTALNVGDALSQLRIDEPDAELSATRSSGIAREGLDLSVVTAKDVTLTVAGVATDVRVPGTVQDALEKAGIKADSDDLVTPAADTTLTDGLAIAFVKVDVTTSTKEASIAFKETEVKTDKLEKGTEKVVTKGVNGTATETYTDVYHDDVLISSTLASTKVTKAAVDKVTNIGTKAPAETSSSSSSSSNSSSESSSSNDLTPASGSTCKASYYWQGQMTANGERFNPSDLTAAHKSFKFGTRVKVTNPSNGKSVIVRINDRGPYVSGRCLDLSKAAMQTIGGTSAGVITVNYEVVG